MVQNRFILDSNLLLAHYIKNDTTRNASFALFERIGGSEMIIPYCVIEEVSTILTYKVGKKTAEDFLNDVQAVENIFIVNDNVEKEIEYFKSIRQKISFTDAALLYLSKIYQAALVTFDQQLFRLYKKAEFC